MDQPQEEFIPASSSHVDHDEGRRDELRFVDRTNHWEKRHHQNPDSKFNREHFFEEGAALNWLKIAAFRDLPTSVTLVHIGG